PAVVMPESSTNAVITDNIAVGFLTVVPSWPSRGTCLHFRFAPCFPPFVPPSSKPCALEIASPMSTLKQLLAGDDLVVAPGVFDGISARIADRYGFDALYMTGYGAVASSLGLPDAGLASYTEMVQRVAMLCSVTTAPLIADGDTGYGG